MTNRRSFLKGLGGAGALSFLGGAGLLSALGNSSSFAAGVGGYKAIVCLFMHGGQDCHDTVIPYDQTSYDNWAAKRTGILDDYAGKTGGSNRTRNRLLALNPTNAADFGGRQFALPDELTAIKDLFDAGNAAIIGNVGPLIRNLNRVEFEEDLVETPKLIFSHNDQQSAWMSNGPEGQLFGWGGKFIDAANSAGANQNNAFSSISTEGINVFLSGETVTQYVLNTDGPQSVDLLDLLGSGSESSTARQILKDHYRNAALNPPNLFQKDIIGTNQRAFKLNDLFRTALDAATPLSTAFPNNYVGDQLNIIAQTIQIRSSLGVGRQVFFVNAGGGFDTHDNQARGLSRQHRRYGASIGAFYQAMVELGVENDVVLFTASDFGRALLENGNGTDHGWGGHHFVVGGSVAGNKIYGDIPPPDLGHSQDAGNGRLIPTTSVEQYAATLGRWFGLSDAEIDSALPHLANFSSRDLGFMTGGAT